MAKKPNPPVPAADKPLAGNFISEWFGYRLFPAVAEANEMIETQQRRQCPFLSASTGEFRECIKAETSKGVCTVSTVSAERTDDWLVCPYRAVQPDLLHTAARTLFGLTNTRAFLVVSAPSLEKKKARTAVERALTAKKPVFVFFQDKLGGEISLPKTTRSPELAFDITLVEIVRARDTLRIGKYGILEAQTMDFHGTYKYAVQNLADALRLHRKQFPAAVAQHREWLSDHIEGPNIANVFKRTFYQMAFKFQMGLDKSCAGCVLAISESVWASWQRHLGQPTLTPGDTAGRFYLKKPPPASAPRLGPDVPTSDNLKIAQPTGELSAPAWIFVFEFDDTTNINPNRLKITKQILTDAHSFAYYALDVAPAAAVASAADIIRASLVRKLARIWPVFTP